MKKVAGISLILTLLVATAFGQSVSRQNITRPRDSFSKESDKRFRKILGDQYDERTQRGRSDNEEAYDEERRRRRKRKQQQSAEYDGTGPDYARPNKLIEMSIRFAPSLNLNTAEGQGSYAGFLDNGIGARMSVGPSLDYFFFKDRYAFSSGLWYTIKRSGFQMPGSFGESRFTPGAPYKESLYNLQYLQVPVSVKMFANNIAPRIRLYVQTGGLLSLKVAERALQTERNGLYQAESGGDRRQYGFGDVELLLGTGVQYKINDTNAFNLGVSYQRGLFDVARGSQLTSKNRVVSLDLGFKF
ncbi:outer membrane beta-barrel protein [Spirosoma sordidisoli]|uniref:PorT family protein n=1 Tax=Spirosoma sordidisoli TaxID=2502893 RepID=A0A4Q2UF24_9BACT|nr:outer membrane beta-barrel protein [Spirosoma sordidisoli]RYC66932.1 PorT family protein [Spirosoma sordidisoli]